MKRLFSILIIIVFCLSLFFIIGCEEGAKTPGPPQKDLTNPPLFAEDSSNDNVKPNEKTNNTVQTAENNVQTKKPRAKRVVKGPKITFESEVHNFGNMKPRSKNKCEFKFTNTGNSELKITKNPEATCGCTIPRLSKRTYAPGESGTIQVVYTAGAGAVAVHKAIYVSSNDKSRPRVGLTVQGNIVLSVRHTPSKLMLMLNEENAKCPNITLSSIDNQPFAIKSFTSSGKIISAAFDPNVAQTKFVIEPKVDLATLAKVLKGNIIIGLTHPKCPRVMINYSTKPLFTLKPSSLVLTNVVPGKIIDRTVWVLNNYNKDFAIESATSKKDIVKVLSMKKMGKRYKLELQITPPEPEEKQKVFSDTLKIKIKDSKELTIGCHGVYPTKP